MTEQGSADDSTAGDGAGSRPVAAGAGATRCDGGTASRLGDGEVLSPEGLEARLRSGDPLTVLDLRNRDEFEEWHVDGRGVTAVHLPLMQAVQAEATDSVDALAADLAEPVVVVCGRGESSDHVAALLREEGLDAVNLAGGMEAWARLYVATDLPGTPEGVTVRQYRRPSSGCLAYLVVAGGAAAVVDPLRAFADRYATDAAALGAELRYAVDTHVHADHVSGVRAVATATGAEPVLPAGAVDRGLDYEARLLVDGDDLPLGGTALRAVHTPGHTSEMTSLAVGDVRLTGDTVFAASVARPDLESGDDGAPAAARRLHGTLDTWFADLPADAVVAPGHYDDPTRHREDGTYTATVGELRNRLDLLSLDREAFVERILSGMPPRPANYETIIETNLGRRDADDEEAFELELGPNNCAATSTAD